LAFLWTIRSYAATAAGKPEQLRLIRQNTKSHS
jgi:hypothetical protein